MMSIPSSQLLPPMKIQPKICDGCGKPPKVIESHNPDKDKNGADRALVQKMLRCSRCKQAWYHDVTCQRRHFPKHKNICKEILERPGDNKLNSSLNRDTEMYDCEVRGDRGRCMVAKMNITKHTRIIPPSQENYSPRFCHDNEIKHLQSFRALVPPVLLTSQRNTRCALCFATLKTTMVQNCILHRYCSDKCKISSDNLVCSFELEEKSASSFQEKYHIQSISPFTLLLYRIVCRIVEEDDILRKQKLSSGIDSLHDTNKNKECVRHIISELVCHYDSYSTDEITYVQTTVDMVNRFFSFSDANGRYCPLDSREMIIIASKLMQNIFTVTDGVNDGIGLGLFSQAAIVNHSCAPNCIQTFDYGLKGLVPSLVLTTCQNIMKGEEICITYTDAICLREKRGKELKENYKFCCDCMRCDANQEYAHDKIKFDFFSEGLRCPVKNCNGFGHVSSNKKYICNICQYDSFGDVVKMRDDVFDDINRWCEESSDKKNLKDDALLDNKMKMMTFKDEEKSKHIIDSLSSAYEALKQCCHISSWYVQEAGDIFVHKVLNIAEHIKDENIRRTLYLKAWTVMKELSSTVELMHFCPVRCMTFRHGVSKLELYLNPDPRGPLRALEELRRDALIYYPPTHEMICDIDETIKSSFQ